MSTQQQQPSNELPSQETPMTDAERAALEGFDANGNPIEPAQDTAAATTEGTSPAATEQAAPAAAAATTESTTPGETTEQGATEPAATTTAVTATASPVFTPQVNPGAARDFAAELTALKAKYNEGAVDDDQYEEQREKIIEDRTLFTAKADLAEQFAVQGWNANVRSFLALPDNAALLRSGDIRRFWESAMQMEADEAAAQGKTLDDWSLLTAGRDRLYKQLGINSSTVPEAPTPTPPPAATPAPNQAPNLAGVPPTLGRAPAAAPNGAKATAEQLAGLNDIEEIERFMATLPEGQAV